MKSIETSMQVIFSEGGYLSLNIGKDAGLNILKFLPNPFFKKD